MLAEDTLATAPLAADETEAAIPATLTTSLTTTATITVTAATS